jgi:hypothetical protein
VALIPVAILFLQLPISLPVWNLLPKLRFLQFPWRWLVVLEAPMGIFVAAAMWPKRRWGRIVAATVCGAVFVAATAYAGHRFFQYCDEEDSVKSMVTAFRTGGGLEGSDEYSPPGTDDSLEARGLPGACLVRDPAVVLGVSPEGSVDVSPTWDARQGSCQATFAAERNQPEHFQVTAVTPQAGFLVLRLRSYPAWRVEVNGQPAGWMPKRDDGLMSVAVPQGAVDVTVDWTTTWDAVTGRWLSGMALMLLIVLCRVERRLARPRLS